MSAIPADPARPGEAVSSPDAWSFDVASLPAAERAPAWAAAIQRLQMPFPNTAEAGGSVLAITSPMGFEFAVVTGGALTIAGRTPGAAPGLWLGLLIDGEASLETHEGVMPLTGDCLIYGATGVDAALRFKTQFRQFFVRIPSVAIDARMLAPLARRIGVIQPDSLVAHALLALLRSAADSLSLGRAREFAPLETALIELLVPVIAHAGGVEAKGGAAAHRARQFERICRTIETNLTDADLSVQSVARSEGVSVRYIQQLFARSGQTVTGYVKGRRLERARADLVNPLHAQLSISEIAFRWGFNQSAHFSRAYRERFEEAPRQTRANARQALPDNRAFAG
ncbi:AraC-like DNA-binding protein [Sphingobium sp. B7D2B]|uniref:helix-turn-helix domain-containing protein n=1 Tax=Sphingobium sp. B7D2B TaxID=2940583 RepID=UPI002224F270|nr:helix-turn-helix domain-containing protein [Sphingobium sp. B7D2B]MCW2365789.1 AraC-like DNA-binding protein [Sphingobium sp. B7D2B]